MSLCVGTHTFFDAARYFDHSTKLSLDLDDPTASYYVGTVW